MTIVLGILALSALILCHEAGHLLVAICSGVKVEAFSLGMGPILLHKAVHGVDLRLSLLPIGGYCGMKGEDDYYNALDLGLKEIRGDKDSFYGVGPLKRLAIALGGPLCNLLLAVLLYTILGLIGNTYYSYNNRIKLSDPETSGFNEAREAGLLDGDYITQINGKDTASFIDIFKAIGTCPDSDIRIKVLRNGEALEYTVHVALDKETALGKIGIMAFEATPVMIHTPPKGPLKALVFGISESASMVKATITGFIVLFKGIDVKKSVMGPVQLTSTLGQSMMLGIGTFLEIAAIVSISLFIMNLLPIPVLDGGLVLFSFIQFVSRRPPSPKLLYYIQNVGIVIVGALMICCITLDILHYFVWK